MKLTANQKEVLNRLLDKYEGSKTYQGTNQVQQSFAIAPTDIWKGYTSDFSDVSAVHDFETELKQLQESGLVQLQLKHGVIAKIIACQGKSTDCYELLNRREKSALIQEQTEFFTRWKERNIPVVTEFSRDQLSRIVSGKKPLYDIEEAENLFRILEFIQQNEEELLERELSMLLLSDSKKFKKSYRSKVCRLLQTYKDFSELLQGVDDTGEREKILLEEFEIYANPSYVHIRGQAELIFSDGAVIRTTEEPIALSSQLIRKLSAIRVKADKIMTVENLTSFHRVKMDNCFFLFLSGYHNSAKQSLLKLIARENSGREWYHFGDLDPDGFYILDHLKRGTGISFKPFAMDVETLCRFREYGKPLEKNDRIKAANLIKQGRYTEVLREMLENNCKLEQEIVSWNLV